MSPELQRLEREVRRATASEDFGAAEAAFARLGARLAIDLRAGGAGPASFECFVELAEWVRRSALASRARAAEELAALEVRSAYCEGGREARGQMVRVSA